MRSDFIILNGFDRSGTSAVTRMLAAHPKVELIMQPFNSGFVRDRMYEIPKQDEPFPEADLFFSDLQENRLNESLIKSGWHEKHSSTLKHVPGQLHVVKTTINHMIQQWMNANAPSIDVWGIWREPEDVIRSIITNGFQDQWYSDALYKLIPTVMGDANLKAQFSQFTASLDSPVRITTFLFAVRSYFFFSHIKAGRVINFERVKRDANALNELLNHYGLEEYDFSDESDKDLNIIGKRLSEKDKIEFAEVDKGYIDEVLLPVRNVMKVKHNIDG
ncbi:MAG: hypothetical protein HWD92_08320 [Flavobacteriia bacterium]|nr:hypothetical protein [Flavobacteriia bacterium]